MLKLTKASKKSAVLIYNIMAQCNENELIASLCYSLAERFKLRHYYGLHTANTVSDLCFSLCLCAAAKKKTCKTKTKTYNHLSHIHSSSWFVKATDWLFPLRLPLCLHQYHLQGLSGPGCCPVSDPPAEQPWPAVGAPLDSGSLVHSGLSSQSVPHASRYIAHMQDVSPC